MPPPEHVARVVGDALTAGGRRARYGVGAAALRLFDMVTPLPLKDRLTRAVLGL